MKLVYLIIILVVASLFAINQVDAHKKHKHGGHGHHNHHVYHHHYYHKGHGHGWNNRYKREAVDVKPESLEPLLDELMNNGGILDPALATEVQLPKSVVEAIEKETVKVIKVDEKVQNVVSFAL